MRPLYRTFGVKGLDVYKIFAIILNQRLVDIVETELGVNSLVSDQIDLQLTISL